MSSSFTLGDGDGPRPTPPPSGEPPLPTDPAGLLVEQGRAGTDTADRPACPHCGRPWDDNDIPPEPPTGTWVRDRYGALFMHHPGGGWSLPGFWPSGRWRAMWMKRGPLIECPPWGHNDLDRSTS